MDVFVEICYNDTVQIMPQRYYEKETFRGGGVTLVTINIEKLHKILKGSNQQYFIGTIISSEDNNYTDFEITDSNHTNLIGYRLSDIILCNELMSNLSNDLCDMSITATESVSTDNYEIVYIAELKWIIWITADTIKTKRPVRRKRLLEPNIDILPEMILIKDLNGYYLDCNNNFLEFFHFEESDIIGRKDIKVSWSTMFDYDLKILDKEVLRLRKPVIREREMMLKNTKRRIEVLKAPLYGYGDNITGIIVIFRDITNVKLP